MDAADNQWHLTSPTPYDTPITYGGWLQSRALGARIASLLAARENSSLSEPATTNGDHASLTVDTTDGKEANHPKHGRPRRRRQRVIIHTSPFQRCVQTSIAISAGMAQFHGVMQTTLHPQHPPRSSHLHSDSPKLNAASSPNLPHLPPIPEPSEAMESEAMESEAMESEAMESEAMESEAMESEAMESEAMGSEAMGSEAMGSETQPDKHKPVPYKKPLLRVDAFLGEWLNPDYYDMITPPPSSVMMVAGAKADLLRPGDYGDLAVETSSKPSSGFPGGWGNVAAEGEGPLSSLTTLGQALPRGRASSHNTVPTLGSRSGAKGLKHVAGFPSDNGGYTPLTPTYAISPSDPIPPGYVTHARDACIEVDYRWDSMREPQDWGTGGEYGEEWGAMHKRYRRATQAMLSWYKDHDLPAKQKKPSSSGQQSPEDEDSEIDTVLVLVSHGAGCNAIIGGLTDRTVLLDVGMASLTMAVRKDIAQGSSDSIHGDSTERPPAFRRASSVSIPVAEDYEVKLMASTEHLRAGANPFVIPQANSSSPVAPAHRHKNGVRGSPFEENPSGDINTRPAMSAAIGSIRRSSRSSSPLPTRSFTSSPIATSQNGLWNRPGSADNNDDEPGPGDDMVLNFGDVDPPRAPEKTKAEVEAASPQPSQGLARANSQRGLWGSSAVAEDRKERLDLTPKRRWTVNDRAH